MGHDCKTEKKRAKERPLHSELKGRIDMIEHAWQFEWTWECSRGVQQTLSPPVND
jgi:hypothetical protein